MKANAYLLTIIFVGLVALTGCKRNDPEKIGPCGVKDPTTELPWIKNFIQTVSPQPNEPYAVFTAKYKGERYFWYVTPSGSTMGEMISCDGTIKSKPDIVNADEETKEFIKIATQYNLACDYLIWASPEFMRTTCK